MRMVGGVALGIGLWTVAAPGQAPEAGQEPARPDQQAAPVPASGPVAQTVWPGIVRWYASAEAKEKAPPSLIVQIPPARFGPGPENARIVPTFGEAEGQHTAHIAIEPGTSLYGCGVVPGSQALNGRKFVAALADRDLQLPGGQATYLAMPWVVAVRADGTAFGVMADTTWRTEIDLTDGITMRADGPVLPIVIVDADAPLSPPAALSQLAGWQEIPPRWALGLQVTESHGSRSTQDVQSQAAAWREHRLPADALWVGRQTTGLGVGAASPSVSAAREFVNELHGQGWRVGLAASHLISVDQKSVYVEGRDGHHWLYMADLEPSTRAGMPPGPRVIPAVTREATRAWWAGLYRGFLAADLDAISDIPGPGKVPGPDDQRIDADAELGGAAPFAAFRSIYGTLLTRTGKEAMKSAFAERRPFVATSVPSLVSQRYGYAFVSAWPGCAAEAIPTILNASMSGQVMLGVDVAGGDPKGDGSDLARDLAVGAMLPMLRLGALGPGPRTIEPWRFSAEVERTCREALERRSRLMPYFYTLTLDAYRYGFPMVRPLFFADPSNSKLRNVEDAFLLGENILVRLNWPHAEPGPESILTGWRKFDFGEESRLLPEMYIRPGAIVPVGPVKQHDAEKPLEPLTLLVCLNEQGEAMGMLYEDDGDGYAYTKNQARVGFYHAALKDGEVNVRLMRLDGGMGMAKRKLVVRVLLPDGKEATTEYWDALDTKVTLP